MISYVYKILYYPSTHFFLSASTSPIYKGDLMRLMILRAFLALVLAPSLLPAQTTEATAIRAVMDRQVADWNRGDIDAFATGYKNSPDILFIGRTISHGYAEMVANYHKHYPTRAKDGHADLFPLRSAAA
jgi:hypothetical protein